MLGYNVQLKITPNSENKYKVWGCNKENVLTLITFVGLSLDLKFCSNTSYAAKVYKPLTFDSYGNNTAA